MRRVLHHFHGQVGNSVCNPQICFDLNGEISLSGSSLRRFAPL